MNEALYLLYMHITKITTKIKYFLFFSQWTWIIFHYYQIILPTLVYKCYVYFSIHIMYLDNLCKHVANCPT